MIFNTTNNIKEIMIIILNKALIRISWFKVNLVVWVNIHLINKEVFI